MKNFQIAREGYCFVDNEWTPVFSSEGFEEILPLSAEAEFQLRDIESIIDIDFSAIFSALEKKDEVTAEKVFYKNDPAGSFCRLVFQKLPAPSEKIRYHIGVQKYSCVSGDTAGAAKNAGEVSLDALSDPACVLDESGKIVHTNRSWSKCLTSDELFLGHELSAGDDYFTALSSGCAGMPASVKSIVDSICALAGSDFSAPKFEYEIGDKWYLLSLTSFFSCGRKVLVVNENITERKNRELESAANESRLNALLNLNHMAGEEFGRLIDYALEQAILLSGSQAGFLAFSGEIENASEPYTWIAMSNYYSAVRPLDIGEFKGHPVFSKVISHGRAFIVNDFNDGSGHEEQFRINRYISVPIVADNKVLLVMLMVNKEKNYNTSDLSQMKFLIEGLWDIIQRGKSTKLLYNANKKLKEIDGLKTNFLAMVSHELRTPLTSVLGFVKINKKKIEKKIYPAIADKNVEIDKIYKQVMSNFDIIMSEGFRLTELINNVLDIAKLEAGKVEWDMRQIGIQDVVGVALNSMSSLFDDKRLRLIVEVDENIPKIVGDHNRLVQVVINLLSNAYKYTDHGFIKCKAFQSDNNEVKIQVSDTGIGINEADQKTIFEKFKRSSDTLERNNMKPGTGLGLALSSEIIKCHDGMITLESEYGRGSTFTVTLPLYTENSILMKNANEIRETLKEQMLYLLEKHQRYVFIIDPDVRTSLLLKLALKGAGYMTGESSHPFDAIKAIRNIYNKPDAVLINDIFFKEEKVNIASIIKNDPLFMKTPVFTIDFLETFRESHSYFLIKDYYIW